MICNIIIGWYRFLSPAGTRLPETPPGGWHCSAHSAGWLNGTHPEQPGSSQEVLFLLIYLLKLHQSKLYYR